MIQNFLLTVAKNLWSNYLDPKKVFFYSTFTLIHSIYTDWKYSSFYYSGEMWVFQCWGICKRQNWLSHGVRSRKRWKDKAWWYFDRTYVWKYRYNKTILIALHSYIWCILCTNFLILNIFYQCQYRAVDFQRCVCLRFNNFFNLKAIWLDNWDG